MSLLRSSLFRSLLAGFLVGAAGLWLAQPGEARMEAAHQAEQLVRSFL